MYRYADTLLGVIDNNPEIWGKSIFDVPVFSPEELSRLEYDMIFIAINNGVSAATVLYQLRAMGIPDDKIDKTYCGASKLTNKDGYPTGRNRQYAYAINSFNTKVLANHLARSLAETVNRIPAPEHPCDDILHGRLTQ